MAKSTRRWSPTKRNSALATLIGRHGRHRNRIGADDSQLEVAGTRGRRHKHDHEWRGRVRRKGEALGRVELFEKLDLTLRHLADHPGGQAVAAVDRLAA